MNKNIITWTVVTLIIIIGIAVFAATRNENPEINQTNREETGNVNVPATPDTTGATQSPAPGTAAVPSVKSFTVTGSNFSFTPSAMTVNQGDTVRITFVNQNGQHDLQLDEFSVGTEVLQGGQSETIEFVADKTGSFEYYCSVGQHRQMGMKGTLTVN